jgi:dolichol-phosphate mannosyltransferase
VKITIVLPTYNEAKNLPVTIQALLTLPLDLSLLIVDDNSPDGTGQIAEEFAAESKGRINVLHRSGKLGLGSAYITAFNTLLENDIDVIGQMDCDFSHPPEKLVEMAEHMQTSGKDVIIGSRYVPGGSVDKNWPLWRKGLSAWGNIYARTILNLPLQDVTGGFRIYRNYVLSALPLNSIKANGYMFQVEMAYLINRMGFTIAEVPIYFADRKWGQSKMSFSIQLEAAIRVWKLPFEYRNLQVIK